ncbi:MAG: hypothetical protein IT370_14045 [Deltaproteobacteria bacterium]|nr:hypothetical protein [Deltaproteobacteria bacterium]
MLARFVVAAGLAASLASCKRAPRKPAAAAAPTRATTAPAVNDAGPLAPIRDAAPDAAQLSFEQAQLADDVAIQVRQPAPGSFTLPKSLHTRFMKDHLFHGAALGDVAFISIPGLDKKGLRLHLGPSTILASLGLEDGDVILKINGRFVDHEPHPEAAFLRILLKLDDGEVDLDVIRGPLVVPCCASPQRVHLSLKLLQT